MSPTIVLPPRTTAVGADVPRMVWPSRTSTALTTTCVRNVGTPGIENVPSAADSAVCASALTVAPCTGAPTASTTRPTTVVSGSGVTDTVLEQTPTLPQVSDAVTSNVMLATPAGTTYGTRYGAAVRSTLRSPVDDTKCT